MTRLQRTILGMLTALLLAGCAAEVPTAGKRDGEAMTPAMEAAETPSLLEDRSLFYEGVSLLSRSGRPDPASARKAFVSFLQRYPKSRLQAAAEGFIRLIDEGEVLREAGRQERLLREKMQAERTRLLQENDQMKKKLRELTEKLQAETALAQENEQLRKDLQRLKALEIELERRDRMLR